MKTVLFLVLMSPLSAFASYQCVSHGSPARGLGINTQDPAHILVFVDHQAFAATVVADEPGLFASTTYELKNGLDQVEGTLVLNKMPVLSMTRGGPSCGRGACYPDDQETTPTPAPKSIVTATLNETISGTTEFSCDEVTP